MSTPETAAAVDEKLADRFQLKAFVESCLVLEEGIAGVRDIDLGMMMGTGMIPGPFARADFRGLDDVLAALERAEDEWGEGFEPPLVLRRLVAQGRLGAKSGQGFYPYPQFDADGADGVVKLETRGDVAIAWLANGQMNSISPQVAGDLERVWAKVKESGVRALVIASQGTMHCRPLAQAFLKLASDATVSLRALYMRVPYLISLAKPGSRPKRAMTAS